MKNRASVARDQLAPAGTGFRAYSFGAWRMEYAFAR
jgi:hypothetical protein